MKIESSLVKTKEVFKGIMLRPEIMFEMLEIDMKSSAERAITDLLKMELSYFIGREPYERTQTKDINYRNGSYRKNFTVKNLGNLNIDVPRDRRGKFKSKVIKKYESCDNRIKKDLSLMFLSGLSTRNLELISKQLIGRKISASEISQTNKELQSAIDLWRTRPLHEVKIKYMYIDGVNFSMRQGRKIEKLPMLVIVGVKQDNRKIFLTIQKGDKESATTWREVFKDLKGRGLDKNFVSLGIMDGLPGLEKVFEEEFPNAKTQRCQVHVARNVLSKVSRGDKKAVADSLRDIFYASSKKKADECFLKFVDKYEKTHPSAAKCLTNAIDSSLTFYAFPEEEWIGLRTTNQIERVNKEFKRRTKPMEILAGENSAYCLLCFIAYKMELGWKSSPLGNKNLPCLEVFTQRS